MIRSGISLRKSFPYEKGKGKNKTEINWMLITKEGKKSTKENPFVCFMSAEAERENNRNNKMRKIPLHFRRKEQTVMRWFRFNSVNLIKWNFVFISVVVDVLALSEGRKACQLLKLSPPSRLRRWQRNVKFVLFSGWRWNIFADLSEKSRSLPVPPFKHS